MSIIAKRFYLGDMYDVPESTASAVALPNYSIGPKVYLVGSQKFDCTQPGLYSFMDTTNINFKRRIWWNENTADCDGNIYQLMTAMCWNWVHGLTDEDADPAVVAARFRIGKVELRCGNQVKLALWWLPQLCPGYQMRQVGLFTGDGLTGYDDGHTLLEVKINGAWRLFDLDLKCYYVDGSGVHLSLGQVIEAGVANCTRVPLTADLPYSYGRNAAGFDIGCYWDMALRTPAQRDVWADRIYQIPSIFVSGVHKAYLPTAYNDTAHQTWLAGLGVTVMSKAAWDATFYP